MSSASGADVRGRDEDDRDGSAGDRSPTDDLSCLRCGFAVRSRPWGCKNPCPNCGFAYPLGDCSD